MLTRRGMSGDRYVAEVQRVGQEERDCGVSVCQGENEEIARPLIEAVTGRWC
jgi:hypothetical protein